MRIYLNLPLLVLCAFITSCVGTVEDKAKIDKSSISKKVSITFDGVASCVAVSDSKIDVVFPPAVVKSGGVDPNTLVYKVFQNGNFDNSVSSKMAQDLRSDESGHYHLEVTDLGLNTEYSFIVRAEDPRSGVEDNNSISCRTRTLSQKLPLFDGVVEVGSFPGVQGQNSLLLKWNTARAAEYLLGGIPVNGFKITKYNIYHSSTSDDPDTMQLLTTINENTLNPITQYQVGGLLQGQKYFYMIRAVDESAREEKNRIVKTSSTSTPQDVSFGGIKTLTVPSNISGYSSLRATWGKPLGDFNRFRVFAVPEDAPIFNSSSIDPNDATYKVADITITTNTDSLVTGLAPNKKYAVFVVTCMYDGTTCVTKSGHDKKLEATTTPGLAPFGGVTSVVPLSGSLGLNNVNLLWSPPAVSAGVCTGINLYEKGLPIKLCGDPALTAGEVCVSATSVCSSSGITVANLETGTQYCFSAKVYESDREQTTGIVEKCITTQFDAPVFQAPPSCIAEDSGTKIKVEWTLPSPEGLYTEFLVIARKHDDIPLNPLTWQENGKGIFENTQVDLAANPSDRYKFFRRPKSTFSYTIAGLTPDTEYKFTVKTYMNASNASYYDNGTTVIGCRTRPLNLNFGGWKHILAVGPRINGLSDHRPNSSTEALATSAAAYGMSNVDFAAYGIEPEKLSVTSGVTHPEVVKDGTAFVSDSGLVQLIWSEFTTPDGSDINTFLYDQGLSENPGDGYFVYRKVSPGASTPSEYESTLNQIQGSNTGWELLNPGAPIIMDTATKTGSFVDLLPAGFHPIHASNGTVAFRDKANTGKVIWYTVRYKLQGKLLGFASDINKDAIAPIIIPPANMASIHQWMANRRICEMYNKDIDRNNDYRCIYGGLGAKEIDSQFYYDMGGHVLVDRWSLGCNFTRFDEEKACLNGNSTSLALQHDITGTFTGADYVNYAPRSMDHELKSGDCIGIKNTGTRQNFPNAPKGAVLYNAFDMGCYYRVGELLTGVPNWDQTNQWKKITELTDYSTSKSELNRLPTAISNEMLGRIYPANSDPAANKGIGAILTSNDSSLPPITGVGPIQGHFLCQSHAITLQVGSNNSAPVRKRLLTAQENTTMTLPHPSTTNTDRTTLEEGTNGSNKADLTYGGFNKSINYRGNGNCNSRDSGNNQDTYYYNGQWTNKLTKIVSNGSYLGVAQWVTGSYDVSGIPGRIDGTERCVSGFGVQDHMGGTDYWLNDQMLCRANSDGSNGDCYIQPTTVMIDSFEALSVNNRWPATRYSSVDTSFFGAESYKNANDEYYAYSLYINQPFTNSFGVPQEIKTSYVWPGNASAVYPNNSYWLYTKSIHYPHRQHQFNLVTGVALNCGSGLCHADDNINYNGFSFPTNFGAMNKKYFEVQHRPTLTADSYFVKYRTRNHNKGLSYSYDNTNTYQYNQYFRVYDGTGAYVDDQVNHADQTHRYAMPWNDNGLTNGSQMGVKCGVKVKLSMSGIIQYVDEQEPE